jgi:hypothetical protein
MASRYGRAASINLDPVVADADPHLLHVEIYVPEVGTLQRLGFLITPQRGR